MSEAFLPLKEWTIADLFDLPDDGHRYEIVDGQLMMVPPPSGGHQYAAGNLRAILQEQLSPAFVVLEATGVDIHPTYRIPDVIVIDADSFDPDAVASDPRHVRLVVEIVSPGSVTNDRITKPVEYARAGIESYWRIENPTTLIAHALEGSSYREVGSWTVGETAHVNVPIPITVRIDDLVPPRPGR